MITSMTDAAYPFVVSESATRPASRRTSDWPLMSDIVSHRNGIPTLLTHWRLADDPEDPPSEHPEAM